MAKAIKKQINLKQLLMGFGAMVAVYLFVVSPFLREGASILDEELERKTDEIKRYISRTGSMPSKKSFDELEKGNLGLVKRLEELIESIDPEKVRISESNSEAGLYFIERLHSLVKHFQEESGKRDIAFPENLGFGDGLPKDSIVGTLLRQLETVEFAMDTLLESEKIKFSAIKPLKSIDYIEPLSKEVLYTELPVQISIETDTDTLMEFLLKLKNITPVVSVKEMHIKSNESDRETIEASFVLSSFKVSKGTS